MDINLNKKLVTKEGILTYLQDIDIYRFYSGSEIAITGGLYSPLRDDNKPSFGYFIGENNEICFNDFVLGGGDFVKFVQLKFGLNYFEALSKIVVDFNLTYHFFYKDINKTKKDYNPNNFEQRDKILSKSNSSKLGKKSRDWKLHDLQYWLQYGIDLETLEKYNVTPISYIFINGQPILADKYAYCFTEYKDGKETYKIYQPYNKQYKWLNNHDDSVWQGWNQLPEKGEMLIITKSLKDVMSITNVLNIPAVSLQAESIKPKKHIIYELYDRFPVISLLYDNDYNSTENWGQKFASNLASYYNIINLIIPEEFESKDFSDLIMNYGTKKATEIWKERIEVPF